MRLEWSSFTTMRFFGVSSHLVPLHLNMDVFRVDFFLPWGSWSVWTRAASAVEGVLSDRLEASVHTSYPQTPPVCFSPPFML